MALGSLFLLLPVCFMFITSLKTSGGAFILPIKWLPDVQYAPQWENYTEAHEFMKWTVVYGNTLIAVAGHDRRRPERDPRRLRLRALPRPVANALQAMLATLMIPYAVRLVPEYLSFARLGMVDTYWPLILPAWFGSAFNIFLLRQFFTTIPLAMDEAAKIDGAGPMRILFQILVPQIRPALVVVAIGSFTFNWNDFLRPLIYLNCPTNRTAAVALSFFQAVYGGTPFNLLMAAALVHADPRAGPLLHLQRYFIQGVVISGVKG